MQYELIFYWRSNHTPARHPQPIPEPSSSDSPTQLSTELNPIHHTVHMNGPVMNTRSVSVITDEGSHYYGVFQMPRKAAFRVVGGEISQFSWGISRRHAPFLSVPLGILRVYRVQ